MTEPVHYPPSRSDRTHGRCKMCEHHAADHVGIVYRWRGKRGMRRRDAYCPRCGEHLQQTAVGAMANVRILDEWPLFDKIEAAKQRGTAAAANVQISHGMNDDEVADVLRRQNLVRIRHAIAKLPDTDPRHIEAKKELEALEKGEQ